MHVYIAQSSNACVITPSVQHIVPAPHPNTRASLAVIESHVSTGHHVEERLAF